MNTNIKRIGMTLLTLTMMTGMFAAANAETIAENAASTQTAAVAEMTEAKRVKPGARAGADVYFECSVPLRVAPTRSAEKITTVRGGDIATYKGQSAYDERGVEWLKVKIYGMTGWVSSKNVHFD